MRRSRGRPWERERFSLLYSIVTLDVPDLSRWGGVGVIGGWDGVGSGMVVSGSVGTGVGVVVGGVTHSRPAASKRLISAVEGLSVNNKYYVILLRTYYIYMLTCISFVQTAAGLEVNVLSKLWISSAINCYNKSMDLASRAGYWSV